MKLHLPLPLLLVLLSSTPLVAVAAQAIYDGTSFWVAAKTAAGTFSELVLHADIPASGASDITVNGNLSVTAPALTPHSLSIDTSEGAVIIGSGGSADFSGLKDVSFGGTTTGSKKAGTTATQSSSYWPVTGGVFVGEGAALSASGNSGSVSNSGNGFSSTTPSSSSGSGGAAYFVAKNGTLDLSHNEGGVNISRNVITVNASGTEAYGAVYAGEGSTVTMIGNASVTLNNNSITNVQRGACGAAIYAQYAPVTISGTTGLVDISNNSARTTAKSQESYSGAIGMAGAKSVLHITDNAAVRVSGNTSIAEGATANAGGGAFRLDSGMEMTGNGSVLFENNLAQSAAYQAKGGAIKTGYSSTAALDISRNGSVSFIGNSAVGLSTANQNRYGGAIYADMNLILADNGDVLFRGNSARSGSASVNSYNGTGGAIKANMSILISGNDSVLFEKNFEQRGSNVMLRSIYQSSASAGLQLQLSAKEGGSITFRDAVYSSLTAATSRAVFNGSYDKTSGTYTQTGSGDIIFSGATTRADLNAVKSSLGLGSATGKEVSDSLRSSIASESAVLGGSLRVEDGAALELSKNLTVFGGATLSLSRGGYVEEAQELIVQSGGTLSFCEAGELSADSVTMGDNATLLLAGASNIITANSFSMGAGSVVSITLNEAQLDDLAALTLVDVDVSAPMLSGITLELGGLEQVGSGSYKLFTIWGTEEIDTYDTSSFTLRGEGVDAGAFRWDAGEQTLFYDYVSPDIVVDSNTSDFELDAPKAANIIVRDNRTATLNSALEAGGAASGNIIIEHGTAAIGEGGSLSGLVIFADEEPEALRTLELATPTAIAAIELRAAEGNSINVTADTATVNRISGTGALEKQGNGTLILSGSESRLQGALAVQSGTLQLQDGASVKADSILLGSRARGAVTAALTTDTLSITPQNGIGSISDHIDLSSDSTALGGSSAERPAQYENVIVRLTQALDYTLNDAVLSGTHVELAETGGTLHAANLTLDSASSLCAAAAGAGITLSGNNALVVYAAENGTTEHEGLSYALHLCDQLDGVTLAAGGTLNLNLEELTPVSPYVALFFKGLNCTADDAALGFSSSYRLLDTTRSDNGLTLYLYQTPEPSTATLSLLALAALASRRKRA